PLEQRAEQIAALRERSRRGITAVVASEQQALIATRSRLTTLGPAATLTRGYAIVQRVDDGADGVVSSTEDAPPGTRLRIRVADGALHAVVSDQGGTPE